MNSKNLGHDIAVEEMNSKEKEIGGINNREKEWEYWGKEIAGDISVNNYDILYDVSVPPINIPRLIFNTSIICYTLSQVILQSILYV